MDVSGLFRPGEDDQAEQRTVIYFIYAFFGLSRPVGSVDYWDFIKYGKIFENRDHWLFGLESSSTSADLLCKIVDYHSLQ